MKTKLMDSRKWKLSEVPYFHDIWTISVNQMMHNKRKKWHLLSDWNAILCEHTIWAHNFSQYIKADTYTCSVTPKNELASLHKIIFFGSTYIKKPLYVILKLIIRLKWAGVSLRCVRRVVLFLPGRQVKPKVLVSLLYVFLW